MYKVTPLPGNHDFNTTAILLKVIEARSKLAELKGVATSIPNQTILIDTLILQEAKESSGIENIITTQDELFRSNHLSDVYASAAAKEVHQYAAALHKGFALVKEKKILSANHILKIQSIIVSQSNAGYRKLPGTKLKNDKTGEVVYTPPQSNADIVKLMNNLEQFINVPDMLKTDPLVKMAIIHHQFESIHPFYDGNGRTGRIINLLYLIKEGLLDIPILYMSRYIINHKAEYYRLLQTVRDTGNWEEWILFMLDIVSVSAHHALITIEAIKIAMFAYKQKIRKELPKIYSQDLLNNLFRHPYTKVEYLVHDIGVSRITATKYLDELVSIGLLKKEKHGRDNYYINIGLIKLLSV